MATRGTGGTEPERAHDGDDTRRPPTSPKGEETDGPHRDPGHQPEPATASPSASPTARERRRRYLVPGESEICRARQSAVVLLRPSAWLFASVLVAAWLQEAGPPVDRVGTYVVLAAITVLLWRVLRWWDFEYVLTDKRILQMADLPVRHEASLALRKVTDISYRQSIPGRLARYGTFTMESAGQNQALSRLEHVADSDEFNRQLSAQLFRGSRAPVEY